MRGIFVLIIGLVVHFGWAQNILYPDLVGDDLLDQLVQDYKPTQVLNYTEARAYMFRNLNNGTDSVEGIYSGYTVHLPDNIELSIGYLAERGINTEHIYPRSKGAAEENGNAFSDLHHLAPSRQEVNSARLSHPFQEIDDDRTTRWFKGDRETFDIPEEDIDAYSEVYEFATSSGFILGDFEPRESVKGDIARAVFYFYTMYQEEADQADRDYFNTMRADLCQWHVADPINQEDMERSRLIAQVQDGKDNPFVLDCSIALRTYCDDLLLICDNMTVPTEELNENSPVLIYPNPSQGELFFEIDKADVTRMDVINAQGQLIQSFNNIGVKAHIDAPNGFYILQLTTRDGHVYSKRIILQK